jgi:hypothetical protein
MNTTSTQSQKISNNEPVMSTPTKLENHQKKILKKYKNYDHF